MDGDSFVSGMANGNNNNNNQVVISTFHKSLVQVQSLLDQNRMLITEINQNHESRAPGDLTRNVGLIRELNNNIRRVVGLYAELSASFAGGRGNGVDSDGDSSGTLLLDARAAAAGGHKRLRPG